jgi:hypothetical protein
MSESGTCAWRRLDNVKLQAMIILAEIVCKGVIPTAKTLRSLFKANESASKMSMTDAKRFKRRTPGR